MKQVTFAPRHHQLTNINTGLPTASGWYSTFVRPAHRFTGETIERVNVNSGTVETIYRATQGAHVGVVTVHPTQERYVFIHGPERPDAQWQYDFHHRRGVVAFQGLSRIWTPWTLPPLHARRTARRQPRPCL